MTTKGSVLFIIAHEGFQPVEYATPKHILQDAGISVITASDKPGKATDKDGKTVPVDLTLDQVNINDYDGIFLIGGPGALEHLDNEKTYRIIKQASEKYMPLGAICISTRILAKAGGLTRKRATGWDGDNELKKLYEIYDVKYLPEPVVVEENVITAEGPSEAETFGTEILALLHNTKAWG